MQKLSSRESAKRFLSTLVMTSLVVPGILLQVPEARATGTLSGQVITNRATATYQGAIGSTVFTSDSNDVTTTVGSVYSLLVTPTGVESTPGQSKNATPGSTVSFPYTLTNTGNAPDTYTITSVFGTTSTGGFSGKTLANLSEKVYFDANGNGIVDVGDTLVFDGATSTSTVTGSVLPDQNIKLIAVYTVPTTGMSTGDKALVDVIATSKGDTSGNTFDKDNFNQTLLVNDATVNVTKAVDKSSGDPSVTSTGFNDILTYTLNANNTGNQNATAVKIVDSIPANTEFQFNSVDATAGTVEYDSTSAAGAAFVADTLAPTSTTAKNVKKLRFTISTLAPSNNRNFTFQVRMNDNTPATTAAGLPVSITNQANYEYTQTSSSKVGDSNTTTLQSNPAQTAVNVKDGAEITYAGQINTGAGTPFSGTTGGGIEDPAFPALGSDRTTQTTSPAGSYVYFKNVIVNNGNAKDKFNIAIDSAKSSLPAGAAVSFFLLTDAIVGANNTSPLVTGNSGDIPGSTPTVGSSTLSTPNIFTFVTQVFIPAGATFSSQTTTTNTVTVGTTTIPVIDSSKFHAGDKITVAGQALTVANVPNGTSITTTTGTTVAIAANAAAPVLNLSIDAVISATSTNGGTPLSTTAGTTTSDTTANIIGSIVAPSVTLKNENSGAASTTSDTFTESANGASVSFPLVINNTGSGSDTFNLTASLGTLPAGSIATFYPVTFTTTFSAPSTDGTSVTIASGVNAGDKVSINGQILTVGTVVGTTVTFATGQALVDKTLAGPGNSTVSVLGNVPITSSGLLAANTATNVIAVISIPANSSPVSAAVISFTSTSTNNGTVSSSQPDAVTIPSFRTFTLVDNRNGTAPRGGTLTYIHTITNNGNTAENFAVTIPANVVGGMNYQLLDGTGNSAIPSGNSISVSNLAVGASYSFTVKVDVPTNYPLNTTDTKVVSVKETTSNVTLTNTDQTKSVDGLISLSKTAVTYAADGTTKVDGSGATAKPGQIIEYRIQYTNIGGQTAKSVVVKDHIPANTTYVTGSMKKGTATAGVPVVDADVTAATTQTDAVDAADTSSTLEVSAPFSEVDFFLNSAGVAVADKATNSSGGSVTQGDSGLVVFRVKVN